jgi:DNA-binding transcriptional MerR regulator
LNKAPDAFRTISEVAEDLDLPQHVLRFWESRFPHIKPLKRGGGRRYYRPDDIDLLRGIRRLLYSDGYTIRGVQRILREQGVRTVQLVGQGQDMPNLTSPPPDNASDGEDGHEVNGAAAPLLDRHPGDGTEDESRGPSADAPALPQNGPIVEAPSEIVTTVARLDSESVDRVPVAVHQAPSDQAAFGDAATAAIRMPPPNLIGKAGLAVQDLDRLKRALAELEACRRLLNKAVDGDRQDQPEIEPPCG